jgi:hypothetical protein
MKGSSLMEKHSSLLILLSVVGCGALPARVCRAQEPAPATNAAPPTVPPDVVETKKGDVYRGTIIERVRGDHVVLLLPSGESRRFDTSDIVSAGPARYYRPSEEFERDPGAHVHDGFYLRLQFGVGYTSMSASEMGTDLSVAGNNLALDVALGGAINTHLIVYGTLVESLTLSVSSKIQGSSTNLNGQLAQAVFGGVDGAAVQGVGGGAAYYLDSNVFFAGSLLGSRVAVSNRLGDAWSSSWGLTFEGQGGKEWWVSDNWALGVAGQVLLGAMKDGAYGNESVPTWRLLAFAVLFSASYN